MMSTRRYQWTGPLQDGAGSRSPQPEDQTPTAESAQSESISRFGVGRGADIAVRDINPQTTQWYKTKD
jgi:hypothetical protein